MFEFGAYFALEGSVQTVPRAELFCFIVLCFLVAPGSVVHAVSDSDLCVTWGGKAPARLINFGFMGALVDSGH